MNRFSRVVTIVVAVAMVSSVLALPVLGGGDLGDPGESLEDDGLEGDRSATVTGPTAPGDGLTAVEMGPTAQVQEPTDDHREAVEAGVDEGIDVVQAQGVEVSQEQRATAVEGALESVAQHQDADVEQVQKATAGAVHGTLVQDQDVEIEQVQVAVGGATDGTLAQYQTASASQMQHAAWGATHGAIAQKQVVTVEQLQIATQGAAAGAAFEAGEKDVTEPGKIQEAAQGAAYGVVSQYQKVTVEQRQQVTLEHVRHAAAGASAGALEGAQDQRVDVEQYQAVTIKQVQKAAKGAAKGALVQRQEVTTEQTQAAARGAAKGPLEKVQEVRIEQVQRVTITQIQEASFGAAKGAISQSQAATVEQIQAAAVGSSGGVLVQKQEVSITQIQKAAFGSSKGAVTGAIQHQVVDVEQVQAAAFGAGEGAMVQTQTVDLTQVQVLADGAASGVLAQAQAATAQQLQVAASGAGQASAQVIQYQRVTVTQVQALVSATAAEATDYAVDAEVDLDDLEDVLAFALTEAEQRAEEIDELEGEASVTFADQDSDGETVVVEDLSLSEGGFIAIHDEAVFEGEVDSVRGVSEYLEPGDHEDVEIELEEPIAEERTLFAVAHLDTTGDEEFTYVETDGEEDVPYVDSGGSPIYDEAVVTVEDPDVIDSAPEAVGALEVTDSEIDVDADEEYVTLRNVVDAPLEMGGWTVEGGENEPYTFPDGFTLEPDAAVTLITGEGEDTEETLYRGLEQPAWDETGDTVIVRDAAGALLLEHELESAVPDLEATLTVPDQEGDGETLVVDEASAPEEYVVTVVDEDGGMIGESETFDAEQVVEDLEVPLDPPLEDDATLDVEIRSTEDYEVLTNETIAYTLEDVPEAILNVSDQEGDGETLVIEEASAPEEYYLATVEDGEVIGESETFDAEQVVEDLEIGLEPPLEDDTTLDVEVRAAEDDEVLASETIEYVLEDVPVASVVFEDQESDGTTVTVDSADVPEGGFVAIYEEDAIPEDVTLEDLEPEDVDPEAVIGVSEYLAPGEYEDLEVDLFDVPGLEFEADALEAGEQGLIAVAHEDVGGTETFEFVETEGEDDGPSVDEDGVVVADDALVTVEAETEPPEFAIENVETNAPIEAGETLEAETTVENVGGEAGTQELELSLDGTTVDTAEFSLEAGEVGAVTLSAVIDEPGEYALEVASDDDSDGTTITVDAPPTFAVTDLSAPASSGVGETIEVSATIENEGGLEGTGTVTYAVDGVDLEQEQVTLAGGESATVAFEYTVPEEQAGTDPIHQVRTEDDDATVPIPVEPEEPESEEPEPPESELPEEPAD